MYLTSRRQRYTYLNIKSLLSSLKDNLLNIILLIAVCYFFFQVHMDGLNHASDKFISLSEGWENIKSNKYMHEMINACDLAHDIVKNSNSIP